MHTARPRMDDGRERDDDGLLAHVEFTVDRVGRESIPNPTVFAVLIFPKHPRQPFLRLVGRDHVRGHGGGAIEHLVRCRVVEFVQETLERPDRPGTG